MTRKSVPDNVRELGEARRAARQARDWETADRLREEIEAAGWRVIDRGVDFHLEPANPPTLEEAGRTRYGSSEAVPSRLTDTPTARATVVLVATDWPADLRRAVGGLRGHAPAGTHLVIVANDPSSEQYADLVATPPDLGDEVGGLEPEVVWTSARLGHAAALNVGLRRARGETLAILDTSVEPGGDLVSPLVDALGDATVAVSGPWGLTSTDLRHFEETDAQDAVAIELYCQAFRRSDYVERGPLDEHFRFYRNLDIWWSLVLRDQGAERASRRALRVDVPAVRHEHRDYASVSEAERDRLSKRNFYRVLDRFGRRADLLATRPATRTGR